jgi:hypothetical protein
MEQLEGEKPKAAKGGIATAPRFALVRDRGESYLRIDLAGQPLFRSLDALTEALPSLVPAPGRYHVVEFTHVPEHDRDVIPGAFYNGEVLASFQVPVARWLVLRSLYLIQPG